jgi:non-homologous end joining protein Ku
MNDKQQKPRAEQTPPHPKIRQAINNLLAAVDKSIDAANDAKKARRELQKLAEQAEARQ